MKAELAYTILTDLPEEELERLFKMLKQPIPVVERSTYINGWDGLSDYMGGTAKRTLQNWEKEGLIQKYKIGKRVFFKKEEIDKSLIPVEL